MGIPGFEPPKYNSSEMLESVTKQYEEAGLTSREFIESMNEMLDVTTLGGTRRSAWPYEPKSKGITEEQFMKKYTEKKIILQRLKSFWRTEL